jgi:hypothetical protein
MFPRRIKKMQKIEERHLFPGMCLLVMNYPTSPSTREKNVCHAVLSSVFAICRHNKHAPDFIKFIGQKPIPNYAMESHETLTNWFFFMLNRAKPTDSVLLLKDPSLWGPVLWSFMHSLSALCLLSDKQTFIDFLQKMPSMLPCQKCAEDFAKLVQETNVDHMHCAEIVLSLHRIVNSKVAKQNKTKDLSSLKHAKVSSHASFEESVKVLNEFSLLKKPNKLNQTKTNRQKPHKACRC